jgi:hypothetical protein
MSPMFLRRRFLGRACAAAIALAAVGPAPVRAASPVLGIFNWIHGTGDAERAFVFYHDVFGIELARLPVYGSSRSAAVESCDNACPERLVSLTRGA